MANLCPGSPLLVELREARGGSVLLRGRWDCSQSLFTKIIEKLPSARQVNVAGGAMENNKIVIVNIVQDFPVCWHATDILHSRASPGGVPRQVALLSLENMLERQAIGSHPRPPELRTLGDDSQSIVPLPLYRSGVTL